MCACVEILNPLLIPDGRVEKCLITKCTMKKVIPGLHDGERSDRTQCLRPVDDVSVLLPTSLVATSAVRDEYSSASSMKHFKCINVKISLPGTPFANAKLLKLFLTGVRMLEEHLAASLGDLRGVRTGEKVDDRDPLVGDAISISYHSPSWTPGYTHCVIGSRHSC